MAYIKGRVDREITVFEADADAEYEQEIEIDLSALKPTVACPHLPENTKTIDELGRIEIQQSVIGSCTNGRIDDMRVAAEILKGRKVHPDVRTIIIPATQEVYLQCIEEGLTKIFIQAGAIVSTPTCGRAWAATWASWRTVKNRFRPRTAISSAAWAILPRKFIWQARPLPRRAR